MVEGRDEPEQATVKKKKKRTLPVDPLTPPPSADTFPKYAPRDYFRYEIIHQSKKSGARVGRIHTPHGVVDTPGYVPVATMAALKAVDHRQMDLEASQQLMFCNTYHLVLQPGSDLVEAAGGLHKFMARDPTRPLITDSGGFQVLCPPAFRSCPHHYVLLHAARL
jgi:queuine tRNA-ribosyltransferase